MGGRLSIARRLTPNWKIVSGIVHFLRYFVDVPSGLGIAQARVKPQRSARKEGAENEKFRSMTTEDTRAIFVHGNGIFSPVDFGHEVPIILLGPSNPYWHSASTATFHKLHIRRGNVRERVLILVASQKGPGNLLGQYSNNRAVIQLGGLSGNWGCCLRGRH